MEVAMLRVLMFHRIADPHRTLWLNPGLVSATPAVFGRIAELLAREYYVASMDEALDAVVRNRPLPARAVLLTFDDAYRDFAVNAWPTLKRYGLPVTLFVPTAYAGSQPQEFWWDRLYRALRSAPVDRLDDTPVGPVLFNTPERLRQAMRRLQSYVKSLPHVDGMGVVDRLCETLHCPSLPTRSTLTWPELRALAAEGVTLAPHTRTHPLLTRLTAQQVREEIAASRDELARETGQCVPAFAYPAGAYDKGVQKILREEGFQLAFTTVGGHNPLPCRDALQLRRTNVTPKTSRALLRMRLTRFAGTVDRWRHGEDMWPFHGPARTASSGKVAYVMSRFPKLTETFVLNEIRTVERLGVATEIYPLIREQQAVVHEEAAPLVARARFQPMMSMPVVMANLEAFVTRPGAYVSLWAEVLQKTWGSLNFFFGAIGILPKCVWMAREMENDGISHLHAHFANHPAVAAFAIHRLTGIPYSFTAHGSDLHVDRRMLPEKVEAAAFVVAISGYNKSMIVEECLGRHAEKVHVVHCGVDPEWFGQRHFSNTRTRFEFVCIASFEPVKGHRYLISACERLMMRGVDFTCHLVGDGPQRKEIERQIADCSLNDVVVLHGAKTRREVARLVARSDAAVLASTPTRSGKREGIPVALMEAMSAGLPVVASRTGGIPELVNHEDSGFLVTPGDPVSLADALERLALDASLRERMGRAGRETILREFDQERCAADLVGLIQRWGGLAGETAVALSSTRSPEHAIRGPLLE
jgi:glycosyltransferase involved in cell wall biosynthesis/peptidoglycan/xylan/chitin deacetylase (PgdA/CDA1 family)